MPVVKQLLTWDGLDIYSILVSLVYSSDFWMESNGQRGRGPLLEADLKEDI